MKNLMRTHKKLSVTLTVILIFLFVAVPLVFAYAIRNIYFSWSANYDGSIVMNFDATGNYHWVTSGRLLPLPEQNFGAWKFGWINGWNNRYMVTGALAEENYRICLGVSDSDPGSGDILYNHPDNRCFRAWRAPEISNGANGVEIFNIYGHIVDSNNLPLSGVSVSDGIGHTAITDWNGDFSFYNLDNGSYTLTPSKNGYTFSPASRSLSGGPPFHVTGQDFTGQIVSPTPLIASLNPASAAAGTPGLTLAVLGSNFVSGDVIRWNGGDRVTTYISSGELRATINTADLMVAGAANVTVFDAAQGLSNAATFNVIASPPPPPPACSVPFFSQSDPQWRDHPLRTNGECSVSCNTIGKCGCTLTSAAMIFKYFGANLTPATLSDCMGNYACPFYWGTGTSCSSNKAQWVSMYGFSWAQLDREINQNHRPVILGMHSGDDTHWIVVLNGSGSNPANYTINDPWPLNGASMQLSAYNGWWFDSLAVYAGQSTCANQAMSSSVDLDVSLPAPVKLALEPSELSGNVLSIAEARSLSPSAVVTGTPWLYRKTDITMTLQLIGSSSAGNLTEMLIWTDAMAQTAWLPFSEFVYLPTAENFYARVKDSAGNISAIGTGTLSPVNAPAAPRVQVFLPLIRK